MTDRRYNFVVFSDDWGRHPSSCQHLFRRIARDHRVLWVNTLGLRAAKADRFTFFRGIEKLREWARPLRRVGERMWVLAPIMLPVSGGGLLARLNSELTIRFIRAAIRRAGIRNAVLWSSLPTAADYVGRIDERAVVYYVTDDFSLWPGGNADQIRDADDRLTQAAHLIMPCNQTLAESHRTGHARTIPLPHAVDFEHFADDTLPEPADLAGIGRPRACFFGLVYEKIDLESLAELARRRADLQIVLIGPVKTNVDCVSALPNVHLLGPRPYETLPAYLHAMDLLIVPYVLDEETANKGPLKIRECLAVGKPIVARAIPDLEPLGDVVGLYHESGELTAAVDEALQSPAAQLGRRMREKVRGHTWAARVEQIMIELAQLPQANVGSQIGDCRIDVTRDCPDWQSYLAENDQAGVFHDPRWGRIMQESYGNPPTYLTAYRDGQIVAALQLVAQQSFLFGSHLSSLPYFDAAGILADDDLARAAMIDAARRLLRQTPAEWVELRHLTPLGADLPTRDDKVTMHLPLPDDPQQLWNTLKGKVRTKVRKAQKGDETTFERGGAELLGEFHAIYARRMRDLGSPAHGRRFFRLILDALADAADIFVLRSDRRAVAAALTLSDRHGIHVPWSAADRHFKGDRANMLLYWHMLEWACQAGRGLFDFGRSTRDTGTYNFKKQWGAHEVPLHWHFLIPPGGEIPQVRPDSPKYKLQVACWKRLPLPLANRIGPSIIAKLS